MQLIGRSGKSILIIAAYRVSQTYPGEAGYSTAYMQQYRALLKENVSKPKPKHRVLIDLASFISNWRRHHENSSVIVMMDANADLTDPHLKTFISDTALHDVIRHHAPGLMNQSTYVHGRKRIDYILVSEDILLPSTGAGHTPYGSPLISDHRGVYWDIPSGSLFDSIQTGPINIPQRGLQLDRPITI